jgi:hypothetical protein
MLKLVDNLHNLRAVLAETHCFGLAYILLASQSVVFGRLHGFEGDFHSGQTRLRQPNWVDRAFADLINQLILVELT